MSLKTGPSNIALAALAQVLGNSQHLESILSRVPSTITNDITQIHNEINELRTNRPSKEMMKDMQVLETAVNQKLNLR